MNNKMHKKRIYMEARVQSKRISENMYLQLSVETNITMLKKIILISIQIF